jgi:hypothetical protein
MTYIKTDWKDEIPNGLPPRYKITDSDNTVIAAGAVIELLNEVVPGTPLNATNLNHLEQGVKDAQDTADGAVSKAGAAQGSANMAASAAASAQTTADAAKTSAAAAQTAANSAASAASAAQTTANTASTAAANAATAAANAQTTANSALTKATHNLSLADLGVEFSNATQTYTDALTATVNLTATGRIRARAYGRARVSEKFVEPAFRLMIDGVADTAIMTWQINTDPADGSWRPFALEWFRAGLAAGNRVVKLQLRNAYTAGTAYLAVGARLVVEVDYP